VFTSRRWTETRKTFPEGFYVRLRKFVKNSVDVCVCSVYQTPAAVCVVYSVRRDIYQINLTWSKTPKALSSLKPQNHVVVKTFTSRRCAMRWKRPRLIPIPEKRRFAFSIVYLIFLIYSTFTPHFRESTAAPVMSAPGGALGPDGVPARIYRYRTFPVLQVVAPPYLHTHASTHASTHPPHTVAHNCGSTHPHTHTRTHIDTLTHPPTHPPPHTHHTHTHTPTHPHTHTHTAVARLAAARLGHVQPISARAPASGAVSRRRGHELPRRGGTRAGGPAIRLGPGHDIVAVFNLFDQLKHSLYNIYIYNIIIIERECCLLVLNLVSSTLSCIRQPRPRLPSY
jgi:hypothetical protein